MNLKGFKKVQEDEHKAVLKNQRGHEITLAKKQLSKSHLDDLSRLPLYSAGGNDVQKPLDFVPGADYSDAPLPGAQSYTPATQAPDLDAAPEENPYTQPMGGAYQSQQPQRDISQSEQQEAQQPNPAQAPPPQQPAMNPQQQSQLRKQAYVKSALDRNSLWDQDLANGHITPETYQDLFAKKDTLGKIGSIFGILASGIGSGLTGQPNAALEMMNKEILSDLDAQKQSKTNAHNFLQLNYNHQLQNAQMRGMSLDSAMKEANLSFLADAYPQAMIAKDHYLQNKVDQIPEGPQKQQYQTALGLLKQHTVQRTTQSAAQAADMANYDPEMAFEQKKEKMGDLATGMAMFGNAAASNALIQKRRDMEEHHFSGYNQKANRPISGGDRDALKSLNSLEQSYNDADSFVKNSMIGTMPFTGRRKYAEGLQNRIDTELGQLSGSNRFTAGLVKYHQPRVPDLAGTHLTNQDSATIGELKRELQQRRASIYSSYGIGGNTQPNLSGGDRAAAEQWLKKNPAHPEADRVKRILGQ